MSLWRSYSEYTTSLLTLGLTIGMALKGAISGEQLAYVMALVCNGYIISRAMFKANRPNIVSGYTTSEFYIHLIQMVSYLIGIFTGILPIHRAFLCIAIGECVYTISRGYVKHLTPMQHKTTVLLR